MWKTNFDNIDEQATLRSHNRTPVPLRPHTHDSPSSTGMTIKTYTHQNKSSRPIEFDAGRTPTDRVTPPPQVINIGPQMFHKQSPPISKTKPLINGGVNGIKGQTTPLEVMTMSPQLTSTLEHIVGQLDILTQVLYIVHIIIATTRGTLAV